MSVFVLLSTSCAFAQQMTATAAAYKDCNVSWREQGELKSLLLTDKSPLGLLTLASSPVELRIPKSKLLSHQTSYDHRSGLWTGTLSPNIGSVRSWGVVAAKEGRTANGDLYVDVSIHFDVCQALTPQEADTSYIVASTIQVGSVLGMGLWYLEPGQTFTFEKKDGEMQLKALMKHVDKGMVSMYPAETKKEHGMRGPFKYYSFIIAGCKQDGCQLWNDVVVPRTAFPQ